MAKASTGSSGPPTAIQSDHDAFSRIAGAAQDAINKEILALGQSLSGKPSQVKFMVVVWRQAGNVGGHM